MWVPLPGSENLSFSPAQLSPPPLHAGFFGDAGETDACGGQNCAYTNPSSPYGLTVLPLSPSQSAAKVEAANTTPSFVKNDMQVCVPCYRDGSRQTTG
jgi:hypothetical protein